MMKNNNHRKCFVVLGMHRSGTSAFTGVLHLLGVNLGQTMLRPTEENPKGFFENEKVTQFNKAILEQLNSSWDDLFLLQKDWWNQEHLLRYKEKAFEIFESEFATGELIGFKDPRMCLLLPFWQKLFTELHVNPFYPIIIRDPEEIAASLSKRNGFSLQKSVILWLNYMFSAEQYSRRFPRIFISFDELLNSPIQVISSLSEEFQIHFPYPIEEYQAEIQQFLTPELKHHSSQRLKGKKKLFSIAFELYRILQELEHAHHKKTQKALISQIDTLRSDYSHLVEWLYCDDIRFSVHALKHARKEIQQLTPTYRAQIFVDCGLGFNERQSMIKHVQGSERKLEFDLSEYHDIQSLRFDPLDDVVALHIDAIQLVTSDEIVPPIPEYRSNACYQNGQSLVFDTKDPNITFSSSIERPQKLIIKLTYLALGTQAYQYIYKLKNSAIRQHEQTIQQQGQTIRQHEQTIQQQGQTIRQHEQTIQHHEQVIHQYEQTIQQQGQTIRQHEQTIQHREQTIRQHELTIQQQSQTIRQHEQTIQHHEQITHQYEQTIQQKEQLIQAIENTLSWKLTRPLSKIWNYLSFMHPRTFIRLLRDAYIIWKSKQFDAQYYLKHNPDVNCYRWGAFGHFMLRGGREGRNPNSTFETSFYLKAYPDVAASGMNPFAHYVRHGRFEERKASKDHKPKAIIPKPLLKKNLQNFPYDRSVAIIILNRDGEERLGKLFTSFLKYNSYTNIHIIVIDHGSRDDSLKICYHFQKKLPIHIIKFDVNYTFAYSNNYAAKHSKADYLFFLNNDIIFEADVLPGLVMALENEKIGVAGIRLDYPGDHEEYPTALQSIGIRFQEDTSYGFYRPVNMCYSDEINLKEPSSFFPAVTAAAMLCRRDEFLSIGGFHEKYIYGYEDVDLCLTYRKLLEKTSYSEQGTYLIHDESATQKTQADGELRQRRLNNIKVLHSRYGMFLRESFRRDILENACFWQIEQTTIAFAVTEIGDHAKAGDYFTAMELAEECRCQFGWNVRYLSKKQETWYNLEGIDYLVVMRDDYDLRKMYNKKTSLITVAWMRNWFHRWNEREWFLEYDLYLCASKYSVSWLEKQNKQGVFFPIASNHHRFQHNNKSVVIKTDYCFTGSYWGAKREIHEFLKPEKLPFRFGVYGNGWKNDATFGVYQQDFVPYEKIPEIYASTKLVIDDANHVTKPWGSANSRIFDALTSGKLVITNNKIASHELFDGELPVYDSAASLERLIMYYLEHHTEREILAQKLQQKVLQYHTYEARAQELKNIFRKFIETRYRIAIKIGAPKRETVKEWGDYHFALALQRCFKKEGHAVRIDLLPDWGTESGLYDDVVLVLRGLSEYTPKPGQINILWQISHPDKVSKEEYEKYDHIFIASTLWSARLQKELNVPISQLLQCTDPQIFFREPCENVPVHDLLFVGNSRKQYRKIVRDCIEQNLPIAVYGTLWEDLIPENFLKGTHIENLELHKYYSNARIVLNDHWESMREYGFLSNRIFDAGACGALIISDHVDDMKSILGDTVITYNTPEELKQKVGYYLSHQEEARQIGEQLREIIVTQHTFANRAEVILATIQALKLQKDKAYS